MAETDLQIVGVGGLPRSGKDTLVEMFIKSGWFGVSLGDIVRNISITRHAEKRDPISVTNMTETSDWLRQTKGSDFALKEALKQFEDAKQSGNYRGLIVWSVRAPVEVDFILRSRGRLIWVEAFDQVRYNRYLTNLRVGEVSISFEELKRQEAEQWQPRPHLPEEIQMNVSYVKQHATDFLENNFDTLDKFRPIAQAFIDKT